ncbi:MAG TPA: OmpA family protein [Bryobacteraceae bacterium]|jgi:outer membrane protein OmpA-like peptidoglycan-associated protein|nr:OmpA family protein [Bryobacteraceae bacterium]
MKAIIPVAGPLIWASLFFTVSPAAAQAPVNPVPPKHDNVPVFHVTVIQNTITAINYQYRQGPTTIDFKGTVLMPEAKGQATVESKRGRTEIDANLEHMLPPQRFGREYLTYTLWAVTPEGGVRNIAEIVPGSSDKATLHVSTDLQAFGLIVTAEPYSAARQPSNVVVMENRVRPETEGKIEEVQAKYELMPRGEYTWHGPEPDPSVTSAPKVSMDEYEATLELYEAQNALGIARAANAEKYATQTFNRAQQLYDEAQRMHARKSGGKAVVQNAREAVQTAEDARMIAQRKQEEETVASARVAAADAEKSRARAEDEVQRARAEAEDARSRADAEHAAREQAEADAAAARAAQAEQAARNAPAAAPPPPKQPAASVEVARLERPHVDSRKTDLRMNLLDNLNGVLSARDTARGLVATIPDSDFSGSQLQAGISTQLARVASVVAAHPGLRIDVEGNTDSEATDALASERADAVRGALISQGMPANIVTARGLGTTRLTGPNSTLAGREANRRVEVVISGAPIGDLAFWDRPYALAPSPE